MSKREMTDSLERPGFSKEVKVVLVGPAKCGKTALIQRFVNDTFSDNYIPTGFEKYSAKNKIGDYTIEYSIWDTSGSGSYDSLRPLAYQDANVFLLCFNLSELQSLDLAISKWLPEIKSHSPTVPIILCGCKLDLLYDNNQNHHHDHHNHHHQTNISDDKQEQGLLASQHIGAYGYIETCSKYPNSAINDVFRIAAKSALGILSTLNQYQYDQQSLLSSSSKNKIKKRKIYNNNNNNSISSISTSSNLSPASTMMVSSSTSMIHQPVTKLKYTNNISNSNSNNNNNFNSNSKLHSKKEIRKNSKNCTIM